ncbi:hypothetical protein [Azospirillum argentinense]|uniref:Uncharacterized protein n=1 Tax=Azospirillum argentinense TaxID=2970906 RepID=A0A5B0KSR6_9PROT|nr:hypothetical protein [Azospirillum argentinense]KAA1053854.1 hypothetical protein FH063_002436 [Azospirillum argentinense]
MLAMEATMTLGLARPSSNDPFDMLRTFRAQRKRITAVIRRLEMDWPCSAEIQCRLAEYITDAFTAPPAKGRGGPIPLLHRVLDRGFDAYNAALLQSDDQRFLAFTDAAFSEVGRVLAGVTVTDRDNRTWAPSRGAPLLIWLGSGGNQVERCTLQSGDRTQTSAAITSAVAGFALTQAHREILMEIRHGG